MKLKALLKENEKAIADKWLELVLATYPEEGKKYFGRTGDRFQNPVGYTLSKEIKELYQMLLEGVNPEQVKKIVEGTVKIRTVQEFIPSETVIFVFQLKQAIREILKSQLKKQNLFEELLEAEGEIDRIALAVFDCYADIREKIFEIRVREVKAHTAEIMNRQL